MDYVESRAERGELQAVRLRGGPGGFKFAAFYLT
jgi:hypothetical protein